MPKDPAKGKFPGFDLPTLIILSMTLFVPIAVLPNTLDNAFNTPKSLVILAGVSLLLIVYCAKFFLGKAVRRSDTSTPIWVAILIFLNFLSFLYTDNYYYTKIAALMNISSLVFFFFVSLHIDEKKAFWILAVVAFSGVLVSVSTYLQFVDKSILFKWARAEGAIMGTIGNSNYLGAYLLFPLFALSGLLFLVKGKWRFVSAGLFIFVFGAFLCSRARASWLACGIALPLLFYLVKRIHNFSVRSYIKKNPKSVLGYGILLLSLVVVLWSVAPQRFHSTMDIRRWTETRTLKFRTKYFAASWWLFKQSPLFGTGLWSYRNRVYDAQAELNKKDPDFFKGYEEPKPRRVHNEYLEILNDGGLVAAGFLLIFFLVVMGHGLRVIRDDAIEKQARIITATASSAMTGMMIAALFFFPFRVNSTLFMTALMMGIMEGIYVRRYGLLSKKGGQRLPFFYPALFLSCLMLAGILWFGALRPFMGELEHLKYKKALGYGNGKQAQQYIRKAIAFDPKNSLYHVYAAQLYGGMGMPKKYRSRNKIGRWIKPKMDLVKSRYHLERAVVDFNGDLTRWSAHFIDGLLKYRMGSIFEAKDAFEKAIYYNPKYKPANEMLKKAEKIIKNRKKMKKNIRKKKRK
jgi:O-antigen ligase